MKLVLAFLMLFVPAAHGQKPAQTGIVLTAADTAAVNRQVHSIIIAESGFSREDDNGDVVIMTPVEITGGFFTFWQFVGPVGTDVYITCSYEMLDHVPKYSEKLEDMRNFKVVYKFDSNTKKGWMAEPVKAIRSNIQSIINQEVN